MTPKGDSYTSYTGEKKTRPCGLQTNGLKLAAYKQGHIFLHHERLEVEGSNPVNPTSKEQQDNKRTVPDIPWVSMGFKF